MNAEATRRELHNYLSGCEQRANTKTWDEKYVYVEMKSHSFRSHFLILFGALIFSYKIVLECFVGFVYILAIKYFMRQYDIIHDDEKTRFE